MSFSRNLRSVNLNSLPILRETLRQRHISKAAEQLNLSQPAVSNVLKAMRDHFDDELLARSGQSLRLTAKGEQILNALELALHHVETAIEGDDFDLAFATGAVRIATVDHLIGTMAGPLSALLVKEAPNLQLQFVAITPSIADDLQTGALDIAITSTMMMENLSIKETGRREITNQVLASERLVCIGRNDDKDLAAGLSVEAYLERPHASFVIDMEHYHTVERQRLTELGLEQKTRILTTSNQSLPAIVAASGCLALIPETLAKAAIPALPIQIVSPPIAFPAIDWTMAWHQRSDQDPVKRWAIDAVIRCSGIFL
jgi:LysR family transcriptional regulator, nod-box dependent transcriptional activator